MDPRDWEVREVRCPGRGDSCLFLGRASEEVGCPGGCVAPSFAECAGGAEGVLWARMVVSPQQPLLNGGHDERGLPRGPWCYAANS